MATVAFGSLELLPNDLQLDDCSMVSLQSCSSVSPMKVHSPLGRSPPNLSANLYCQPRQPLVYIGPKRAPLIIFQLVNLITKHRRITRGKLSDSLIGR